MLELHKTRQAMKCHRLSALVEVKINKKIAGKEKTILKIAKFKV
jgi:hypothetical protein